MPEPKLIPLTVRRLKPGAYEQWRSAWDDPAITTRSGSTRKRRPTSRAASTIPTFTEEVLSDGSYEVVEVVTSESRHR